MGFIIMIAVIILNISLIESSLDNSFTTNVVLLLNGFNMSATRLAVARAFLGEAF